MSRLAHARLRNSLLLIILALLPTITLCQPTTGPASRPATAPSTTPVDISGVYDCEGDNVGVGGYHGTLTITKVHDAYKLKWKVEPTYFHFAEDRDEHEGIGMWDGNVLSAAYVQGRYLILVRYESNGNRFVGKWTTLGGNADYTLHAETLTKQDK
jgi:hypothetical protein